MDSVRKAEDEATFERVAKRFRELDTVDLDLHLLLPDKVGYTGPPLQPQRMPLPSMFKLLALAEGRALCQNLPRVVFRNLPSRLSDRHGLEVISMFYVAETSDPLHLRFVLDYGAEVRYDVRSDRVAGCQPGIEVFRSRITWASPASQVV